MKLAEFKKKLTQPLRQATLVFLVKDRQALLAMKKRGFGAGRWNGVGGKVSKDETVEEAAIREAKEEIGVDIIHFSEMAVLDFYFIDEPLAKDWNQQVVVYVCDKWGGKPVETEEMAPKWFNKDALPFQSMWPDDPLWLPLVLQGEALIAEFGFGQNGEVTEHNIARRK